MRGAVGPRSTPRACYDRNMPRPANIYHSHHATYVLKYHIVWITKYRRRKFIEEKRTRCKEVLHSICVEYEWIPETLEVSSDHIHLYLVTDPADRPCDVVAILKSKSASVLKQEFPELQAGKGRVWGRGYFISSVNDRTTSKIINQYIRNHNREEERLAKQLRLF